MLSTFRLNRIGTHGLLGAAHSLLPVWLVVILWTLGATADLAPAQCTPQWQRLDPSATGQPGVNGGVYAMTMWDPDGPGPSTPRLVVGGAFTTAGNAPANRIATYDPATGNWSPLGSGMNGEVYTLAVLPGGDLVAGGGFSTAGGVPAGSIARWNGSAWSPLETGVSGRVRALALLPNGDLVAGGAFWNAGGVAVFNIARWNGSIWSAMGPGLSDPEAEWVSALAVLPNGDLVAGGWFGYAGGGIARCIARWNGSSWSPLGDGMGRTGSIPIVVALTVLPTGELVAGGVFTTAGGVSARNIARWDGSAWSPLGSGMDEAVSALTLLPNGDMVAGGAFTTAGGVVAPYTARWGCCPGARPGACSRADWNEDGVIDFNDLLAFLGAFHAAELCADLTADGAVDFNDVLAFLNLYNAGC